jgi:transposase
MARKNYSEQFRRQAVDLYESTPGATLKGIAADLGIERATLARWVEVYGTGKKTTADGTTVPSVPSPSRARRSTTPTGREPETPEAKIARLEARVAELEASETKLATEREILRQAAKYFAGETRW